jgi:hypothetical protein
MAVTQRIFLEFLAAYCKSIQLLSNKRCLEVRKLDGGNLAQTEIEPTRGLLFGLPLHKDQLSLLY